MLLGKYAKLLHIAYKSGIIGKNVRYLPTILKNYYLTYILKSRTVISCLEISIDFRCNLHCSHCATNIFQSQLNEKRNEVLTTEEIKYLVRQAKELGGYAVVFIGGEPLLRKDIDEILRYTYEQKLIPYIFTNATLIDRKRARELKECGLFGATVSLHGIGRMHDKMTNVEGSYDKTAKGIECLRAEGIYVKAGLVPTRDNIRNGELGKILQWCDDNDMPAKFNLVMPVGMLGHDNVKDVLLEKQDVQKVTEYLNKYRWLSDDMLLGRYGKRCPAGNMVIEISEFGDVFPCFFIHISYGNIRQLPLKKIVGKMRNSPYFNERLHDHCIAALNREFIDKYMREIWNAPNYPLKLEDHSMYNRNDFGANSL